MSKQKEKRRPSNFLSKEQLLNLRNCVAIQGQDGNWNHDPYMHGMFNGMELMLAIIERREPAYRDKPQKYTGEAEPEPPKKGVLSLSWDDLQDKEAKTAFEKQIVDAVLYLLDSGEYAGMSCAEIYETVRRDAIGVFNQITTKRSDKPSGKSQVS